MNTVQFGGYLRQLRIERQFGLRMFAEEIGMAASNLSNIEHGRLKPPQDPARLERIAEALGLEQGSADWNKLHNLAVEHKEGALAPDVAAFAGKTRGIPVLLRTIQDKKLSPEELEALAEEIEERYSGGGD